PARVATVSMTTAATAEVAISPRAWGTEITLDITGLPARPGYQLWAVDVSGSWAVAATWSPTSTGEVRLTGATGTPTSALDRIVVTSNEQDDILVDALL
ncbi:MAG: hypothetical protein KDB21_06890, partial [Acidimicrobiales bacterium]|nr:hypothetical protein [Acidimicrobiales bacterium]